MSGNTQKILIVVFVVLVVLFVVGTGLGLGDGIPGLSVEGMLDAFGGLIPSPSVSMAEISASPDSCFDQQLQRVVLSSLGQCVLVVDSSDAVIRTLTLTSGSVLRVRMTVAPAEGKALTVTVELPREEQPVPPGGAAQPTNQLKLDVYGRGGTIVIDQCVPASGSACVIDLS